jgi:NAD(P)-dependent dehydrogenase (short-subunit alcohol dehydrogenase family)
MRLDGKTALVTGSSRGIGRGIALKLADQGARVAITYLRDDEAATRTLADVRELGSDGFVTQCDVGNPADIDRLVSEVRERFGSLDILVSNARSELAAFYQPPLTLDPAAWRQTVESQATALLLLAQQTSALMQPGGRIIAITYAPDGRLGSWQSFAAMGSAKAAVESLCRYFAVALAPRQITVNAVSPGFTTDSVVNSLPDQVQTMINEWHEGGWTPARRMGSPADAGDVVALLCSELARWITGQVIVADGGASLMDAGLPLAIQQA